MYVCTYVCMKVSSSRRTPAPPRLASLCPISSRLWLPFSTCLSACLLVACGINRYDPRMRKKERKKSPVGERLSHPT